MSGEGLVIQDIVEDGAAANAGLQRDDKIVTLDDKPLVEMEPQSIRDIFAKAESIEFSILRNGQAIVITVSLTK